MIYDEDNNLDYINIYAEECVYCVYHQDNRCELNIIDDYSEGLSCANFKREE